MKRRISIIGTPAFENWNTAEASANKEILEYLSIGVLIAVVTYKKLKAFGYDTQGVLRSKCWELVTEYTTITNSEEFLDLKTEEAKNILISYFKDIDVEINVVQEKVPA